MSSRSSNRERQDPRLPFVARFEACGGVLVAGGGEELGELERVPVGDGKPREHHRSSVHLFVLLQQWSLGTWL